MAEVDITIIGAGVVGLAIALELSSKKGNIVVIEREPGPGMGVSSRNSEVIHAGIYYPESSLKARLCVEGAGMLYRFCQSYGVPFKKIGKTIVAADMREEKAVEELFAKGLRNGVDNLQLLDKTGLNKIEPHVSGHCALLSPDTGIIDTHRLIKTLEAHCLGNGTDIFYRTELVGIRKTRTGFSCTVLSPGGNAYTFSTKIVINAAGLSTDRVASLAGVDINEAGYRVHPVKGEYFRVRRSKQHLINGLVYPVPEENLTGLGIHATKDLSGSMRLGPNTIPVDMIDYDVDPSHATLFLERARRLLSFLEDGDLMPDMAGIRPKIQRPGESTKDFVIAHEENRGLPGMINLVGIESPGLTSSLAIGRYVAGMIQRAGLLA